MIIEAASFQIVWMVAISGCGPDHQRVISSHEYQAMTVACVTKSTEDRNRDSTDLPKVIDRVITYLHTIPGRRTSDYFPGLPACLLGSPGVDVGAICT